MKTLYNNPNVDVHNNFTMEVMRPVLCIREFFYMVFDGIFQMDDPGSHGGVSRRFHRFTQMTNQKFKK